MSDDLGVELSVDDMYSLAKKNKFPSKKIKFGEKVKKYTATLHFFKFKNVYRMRPTGKIKFVCKVILYL